MDLSGIELFKQFTPDEQEKFLQNIETLELGAGDILFNEGDPGDALYIIYSGSVRIFRTIDQVEHEEKSLALLDAGTYLGEMTLMDGTPRSASARAESNSVVLRITRTNFIKLLRAFPQVAIRLFVSFMNVVSSRLRNTNDELVVLYEVGKIISVSPPMEEMLSGILNQVMKVMNTGTGAVLALNEFNHTLELKAGIGEDVEILKETKIKGKDSIIGLAIERNEILLINDFESNEEFASVKRYGFEKNIMLIAPLVRGDKPFGAFYFTGRSDGELFDNANANLVSAVSNQAAAALEASMFHQDRAAQERFDRKYFRF